MCSRKNPGPWNRAKSSLTSSTVSSMIDPIPATCPGKDSRVVHDVGVAPQFHRHIPVNAGALVVGGARHYAVDLGRELKGVDIVELHPCRSER